MAAVVPELLLAPLILPDHAPRVLLHLGLCVFTTGVGALKGTGALPHELSRLVGLLELLGGAVFLPDWDWQGDVQEQDLATFAGCVLLLLLGLGMALSVPATRYSPVCWVTTALTLALVHLHEGIDMYHAGDARVYMALDHLPRGLCESFSSHFCDFAIEMHAESIPFFLQLHKENDAKMAGAARCCRPATGSRPRIPPSDMNNTLTYIETKRMESNEMRRDNSMQIHCDTSALAERERESLEPRSRPTFSEFRLLERLVKRREGLSRPLRAEAEVCHAVVRVPHPPLQHRGGALQDQRSFRRVARDIRHCKQHTVSLSDVTLCRLPLLAYVLSWGSVCRS